MILKVKPLGRKLKLERLALIRERHKKLVGQAGEGELGEHDDWITDFDFDLN